MGFSPAIGFYLSGMDEVREQVRDAVSEMSNEDIGRPAVPGAHSVGALVLHIGEAEWFWMVLSPVRDDISIATDAWF